MLCNVCLVWYKDIPALRMELPIVTSVYVVSSQTKYVALSMVFEYAFLVYRFLMFKHLGNTYQQGEEMMKIEQCFIYD